MGSACVGPCRLTLVAAGTTSAVLFWIGVLMALALLGGVIVAVLRRRILGEQEPPGLVLDDLRRLRDAGEITWEEFDRLKGRIVDVMRASGPVQGPERPAAGQIRSGGGPDLNMEVLEAPPGFDLTGEPLPKPRGSEETQGPSDDPGASAKP